MSRPRANTATFSPWWRGPAPAAPAIITPPQLSLEALVEALTPPNQPSLGHARTLANILPTQSPIPPLSVLTPVIASLCASHVLPLQAAGYEVMAAYFENDENFALQTSDRITYLSLFLTPPTDWSYDLWEPRFRALRALTNHGKDILVMELEFMNLLKTWIRGAFEGLVGKTVLDPAERSARERSTRSLAEFLTDTFGQPSIAARLPEEELKGVLQFYTDMVDQAICSQAPFSTLRRDNSMSSLPAPESPASGNGAQTRPIRPHQRHLSSLSSSSSSLPMALQTIKPPADLATSIYLGHLAAQVKIMTPTSLDLVFPLLFRALAFYTTPLPRLSITSPTHTVSHLEGKILEMLDSLISGPYATSCMIILKRHLNPPAVFDDNLPTLIQSTIGAQRTLRNHIRRGLCNRLTRTYRSRESSTSYTTSSVPSLRSDLTERAWPKDEISSWDPGKLGRILCKSVDAWVAVELDGGNLGRDAVLEEAAGTLKDVLEELDSREENVLPEEEEASAVGKTLYRLASYVHLLKNADDSPLLLPISRPDDAPTPFLRLLCSLLGRDHKMYINPPLSATLLSIADHLADVDTANLPAVMLQQQDLSPTAAGWLSNWESLFKHSTMLDNSRPLTRQGIMQTLRIVYDSVKDMPKYRKQLANLVYDFCERQVADGNQDGEAMWRILGDEVVLRTVEAEATEVDVDINSIAAVGHMVALLSGAALERDGEGDDAVSISTVENRSPSPHHAIVPDASSPLSPATLPRIQTDNTVKDKDSNLPSVMAAVLTSFTTVAVPRSPSLQPQVADEPPPAMLSSPAPLDPNPFSRPVNAVVALVNIFSQLAFTPLSFSQTTLELTIQIFLDIVKVLVEGDSSMAKLTALQFLTRLRADRAHRLYLVDTHYDPDGHIRSLAVLIDRYVAEDPDGGDYHGNLGEPTFKRRARPRRPRNENARQPAQGRGARLSTSSGSRPRAPFHSSTSVAHPPAPKTQEPLWSVPEQIPFVLRDIDTPSEIIVSYAPAGPDNTLMLPLSVYLAALIDILGDGTDWEVFSYILCHLPVQLANKHLFCGPKCRKIMPKLLQTLGRRIIEGKFASEIDRWPQGIKPRDAQGLAFHTLSVLIGYSPCLDVQHCHLLVEVLQFGLNGQPSTIKCCLHALSLAAFELPTSMTRCLTRILDNLSQIMSNPNMAVHILAFLSIVVSLPHLYSNFTENDFKMVFGVALKYLQYHNPGSSPTSSWALSQHVRFISYYVVYAWFLAVKLQDRPRHVGYITRELLIANEGRDEVDDYTEVCFDWLARYTYGSADPRPANSLLDEVVMNPTAPETPTQIPLSEKAWVWGNSIVNIRALSRLGWIEVISRRPSGMTKFLCRVENVPFVGPGEADFDPVSVLASLVMDYRPPSAPAPLQDASPSNQDVIRDILSTDEDAGTKPRPDSITGYVWSGTAPSQRRKHVAVDPAYFALQLSAYPHHHTTQCYQVTNPASLSTFLRNLDRMPVIDTHKVGILYVAPGQTQEAEILRNTHGSPAYTRFLEGIGRLINLRGQVDIYAGGLDPDEDGEYAYAWWDDIAQILYHTATMMPTKKDDPTSNNKKKHIGNDFVRIVWNDSGLPYRFDTLSTQFQFVNIIVEPHSLGAISAFSNNLHENEYFKITIQHAERMPEFAPVGSFKLISAVNLPLLLRQLSFLADWFASVFARTQGDTERVDVTTNWQSRLQTIRRFHKATAASDVHKARDGMVGPETRWDFTTTF